MLGRRTAAYRLRQYADNPRKEKILTMLEEMEKNQKYRPDYGYTAPKRTRKECTNPAFMDHNLHRVGYFKLPEYYSDGLPGYVAVARCVNCGRVFADDIIFHAGKKSS